MDRVSLCNIYAVQQDTQSFLMIEFYLSYMLARHVSDLIGPSSGAPENGQMMSEICRANIYDG